MTELTYDELVEMANEVKRLALEIADLGEKYSNNDPKRLAIFASAVSVVNNGLKATMDIATARKIKISEARLERHIRKGIDEKRMSRGENKDETVQ